MSMYCELCGGQVIPNGEGGICTNCGITYDAQWMEQHQAAPTTQDFPAQPANKPVAVPKWAIAAFVFSGLGALGAGWMADENPALSLECMVGSALIAVVTILILAKKNKK